MSKIVIVAVFIFWVAVSALFANKLVNGNSAAPLSVGNQNVSQNAGGNGNTLAQEMTNHNTASDCWLSVDGNVYNVTSFISQHPGGPSEIIPYCGKDATIAFSSKGKFIPQQHSATAHEILASFYVGKLTDPATGQTGGTASASNTNTTPVTNTNPAPSTNTGANLTLTLATIATHNTSADCWVTAGSNVYDVTSFIFQHPGGSNRIIPYCGADVAAAFSAQGHSQNAQTILASMKIGTVGQSITTPTTNPTPIGNTGGGRGDDDDEDDD